MIYRVELEVADKHVQDGFLLTEDLLVSAFQAIVQRDGRTVRDVKSEDVKATIIQELKFQSNIKNFIWRCCDLNPSYWIETRKLFFMWRQFRHTYSGTLSVARLGKIIKKQLPEITWTRKWINGKQIAIYKGVRLREVYVGETDDD